MDKGMDGALNMSGYIKGVQTIIRNKYLKALYVHCVTQLIKFSYIIRMQYSTCTQLLQNYSKNLLFFVIPQNVIK